MLLAGGFRSWVVVNMSWGSGNTLQRRLSLIFAKKRVRNDMSFQNFPYSLIDVILLDHQFHTVPQVIDK